MATKPVLVGLITALALNCSAQQPQATSREAAVKAFLQQKIEKDGETVQYIDAFVDLNDDGRPEVIVYLIGSDVCGSGGCSMWVLTPEGSSFRILTETTITQRPIRVLNTLSHGWKSLGVFMFGGGIVNGFEVALDFDGKSYQKNPNRGRRLPPGSPGQTLIPNTRDLGKPIFP